MPTILFVGGGSIGHIAPSVAVARVLKERSPDVRPLFIVSMRSEDRAFVEQAGFDVRAFDAPRRSWNFPWRFRTALRAARHVLQEERPALIFSKGGFVSVPICLAAKRLKIPIVLHESDAVSGWANWLISRWAAKICLGFEGSIRSSKAIFTGTPVRTAVIAGSRQKGLTITGLSHMRPILLVLGGSLGALALNQAIATNLTALLEFCDIIHITGQGKALVMQNPPGYWQCAFADKEYPHLLAAADMALSRAGATTLAELAAVGLPTILVPLDKVAHDHQRRNAEVAVQSGGCILLDQSRLASSLIASVRRLIDAADSRRVMGNAIRALHRPDSARQIAEVIAQSLACER